MEIDGKNINCNPSADGNTAAYPIVLLRPYHNISRKLIDKDALTVLYRLKNAGYTAYLVGGAVRDLLLGITPKDFDVGTDAHPNEIKSLFKNCYLIGRRFRLAHIHFGKGKIIETATFRKNISHKLFENENVHPHIAMRRDNTFGTPEEDAFRRDFTINALFYDIRTFSVIDYTGGLADIQKRIIRSIGPPEMRYREDPVRMMRAIRLAARLNFTMEEETAEAIHVCFSDINVASPARLLEEIYRLFQYGCSAAVFRLLIQYELFEQLFPHAAKVFEGCEGESYSLVDYLDTMDLLMQQNITLTPEIMIGVVYLPLFLNIVVKKDKTGNVNFCKHTAASILKPFFLKYRPPKIVYHRLVNIYGNMFYLLSRKNIDSMKLGWCRDWLRYAVVIMKTIVNTEKWGDNALLEKIEKRCWPHHNPCNH